MQRWSDGLLQGWENLFERTALEDGRRYYRSNDARSVELRDGTAVVAYKEGKQDWYVVLDLQDGAVQYRSSIGGGQAAASLAVAGLYEVEELLASVLTELPGERPEPSNVQGLSERPAAPVTDSTTASASLDTHSRQLTVVLDVIAEGIKMEGAWSGGRPGSALDLTTACTHRERELLIRLLSLLRKAGFVKNGVRSEYVLRDRLRWAGFVQQTVPLWRKFFAVSVDPGLELLGKGLRTVTLKTQARASGSGGIVLDWNFYLDGELLNERDRTGLLRARDNPILLPGKGLVQVRSADAAFLRELRPVLQAGRVELEVPWWLLVLQQTATIGTLELDPRLRAWLSALSGLPKPLANLPVWLRPYQKKGVEWLQHLLQHNCPALLADEMGLGKTLQVLALIQHRKAVAQHPVVVVCPASVTPVWQTECERFFPDLTCAVVSSADALGQRPGVDVWVVSYSQLRRQRKLLESLMFSIAIIDEAQFIKNPDAKATHACLALKAQHRIALSGTPLENRLLDLWTLFRFLMPGLLGTRALMEERQRVDRPALIADWLRRTKPFILRRCKADVLQELPDKLEMALICPMTDLQKSIYQRYAQTARSEYSGELAKVLRRQAMPLLALLTRLRQTCCDPGLLPDTQCDPAQSGKILTLLDRLSEIQASGGKAVVFSQFTSFLERIELAVGKTYPDLPRFLLTGSTVDRKVPVTGFQKQAGAALMLVSLKAGGTGITLNTASTVFLMDPWWNPAVEQQAMDRVHRMGQRQLVSVYRLITQNTIEEKIEQLKTGKRELFASVFDARTGDLDWKSAFSDVRDLL